MPGPTGWWREHLRGLPTALELPTDEPRPSLQPSGQFLAVELVERREEDLHERVSRRVGGQAEPLDQFVEQDLLVVQRGGIPWTRSNSRKGTRWRSRALGDVRLVNAYGPTECVITATAFHIDPATVVDPAVTGLPIGTALRHRRLYVIDDAGRPVADTGTGQLAIGGDCIAQGYLGDSQLTADRFVTDPFSTEPGARMYLTGDIVRRLADGNLEFLHRIDNQVKIQGYRIELGEIEAALRDLPHVSDAAALVLGDGAEAHLAAGVTATDGAAVDANHLRIALADALPTYMVPRVVVGVERLPVTLSGKVDRVRLAEILVAHGNGKA